MIFSGSALRAERVSLTSDAPTASFSSESLLSVSESLESAFGPLPPALSVEPQVPGDLTGDGWVEHADVAVVETHWGGSGPDGDANDDNAVDIFDVNMISDNWNPGVPIPEPATLSLVVLLGLTLSIARFTSSRRRRAS